MTDELFEQRLRRDLRRLADEMLGGPLAAGSPAGAGRWRRSARALAGGHGTTAAVSAHRQPVRLRRARSVLSPAFSRTLAVVWVVVAVCLVGSGVVAGRVLTATPTNLNSEPAVATLSDVPGPLAFFSGSRLYAAEPGSAPRPVIRVGDPGSAPQWSADNTWIAYLGSGGHLHLVRPDGAEAHLALSATVTAMTWSPASNLLAVVPASGPMSDDLVLVKVGATTSTPTVVATHLSSFVWSADGRQIAFGIGGVGSQPDRLFVYNVVSGVTTPLSYTPPPGTGAMLASWWPDGSGLLLWLDPGRSPAAESTGLQLVSVPLDGTGALALARTFVYLPWLAWSPDGHRLALVAQSGSFPWQGSRVEVCRPASGTCTSMAQPAGTVSLDPAWSPGGGRLAFVRAPVLSSSSPGGGLDHWYAGRRLWIASADGANAHPVAGARAGAAQPAFGPSGRSIVYVTADAVHAVAAAGGHDKVLVRGLGGALDTAGPDGYGKLPWGGTAVWGS